MTPFVDSQIGTAEVPRVDPYIDLEQQAEALALRLLPLFPAGAPDDAYQVIGPGGTRITAGQVRGLFAACQRARRLRR